MKTKLAVLTIAALFTGSSALAHSFGAPGVQSKANPFGLFVYEIMGATPHILTGNEAAMRADRGEAKKALARADDPARATDRTETPRHAGK